MGWFGHQKLGVALVCADWRLHHPRVDFYRRLAKLMKVDVVDVVAVPGPDGLLLPDRENDWNSVVGWVRLLIGAHEPSKIAVVAHQKCAGHNVDNDQHEHDVLEAAVALKERTGFEGGVLAVVAVHESDKKWGLNALGEY